MTRFLLFVAIALFGTSHAFSSLAQPGDYDSGWQDWHNLPSSPPSQYQAPTKYEGLPPGREVIFIEPQRVVPVIPESSNRQPSYSYRPYIPAPTYYQPHRTRPSTSNCSRSQATVDTVIGAVVGGAVGSRFGSGSGNTAATIAGAIGGGALGNAVGSANCPDSDE